VIYPLQVRAARVLLGLSQQELAEASQIGLATLKRVEAAGGELTGTAQTMARIERALESKGIVFIDQDDKLGPGVRLKKPLR
jgi:transcriptional regulator with XRE-family HTH domain